MLSGWQPSLWRSNALDNWVVTKFEGVSDLNFRMCCRVIRLLSRDVYSNLAAEECLFQCAPSGSRTLLFYVNGPSVVVGRTQNPFFELDLDFAASTNTAVSRRRSGGGTVVHDDGNLNFCFMSPREHHDPAFNSSMIVDTLRETFGLSSWISKRGDIMVHDKKVSGAAFRITRDRAYHHGTLLVNSNLAKLRRLLQSPQAANMAVTGASSVPSPVMNLADVISIDIPEVINAISENFIATYNDTVPNNCIEELPNENIGDSVSCFDRERKELSSEQWIYGQSPRFSFRVPRSSRESEATAKHFVLFMSKGGKIERVRECPGTLEHASNKLSAIELDTAGPVHERYTSLLAGSAFARTAIDSLIRANEHLCTQDELSFLKSIAVSIPKGQV